MLVQPSMNFYHGADNIQEELKPKNERRPIPKTPPGVGEGGGGMSRQEIEALNQAAQEAYNVHVSRRKSLTELLLVIKKVGTVSSGEAVNSCSHCTFGAEPEVEYGRAKPLRPHLDNSSSQSSLPNDSVGGDADTPPRPTTSGPSSRALTGSLASNRKTIPGKETTRKRIQSPLEQGVDAESLKKEIQGKESMVSIIQAKLERWESTTMATLQEIRDLKEVFAQINTS
ncbi:unnamed protein product [Phytophthora fragariaefolia]|uniref:Unnamed protein product n=1 Tax=Phytophthora fragariaefolia TaxID=1490495 RepID=A0A9W6Y1W5_9STRA|nr:unnamed protein product [Phytophthora fragariaefolia]